MIPPQSRATVLAYARQHDLLRPGPLVVAVSGGTDSTALLLLLADLAEELGLALHVAHFDHRARPGAADAAFVTALAAQVGAPIRIGRAVARPASEDDARQARYAFLRRAAAEVGAARVATAHTRDDQAETVLLHAARGSGLDGLAGMRPARDGIVRPFLALARADTVAICAAAAVLPREDPSNRSLRFARNRVRRRVLPELARINPQVAAALVRLAEAAAAVGAERERRAAEALTRAADGEALVLDRLDGPVRGESLALWWKRLTARSLSAANRAALERLCDSTAGSSALDLPGGRALREYQRLRRLPPDAVAAGAAGEAPAAAELALGEPRRWEGWTILLSDAPDLAFPLRFPAPATGTLLVRGRRPGDRIGPDLRMKVQDLFTDAKVPARMRDAHPLVTTTDGAVWWAVGLEHAVPPGGGRWLGARPPDGVAWSFADRARSIEPPNEPGKDERHELR